MNDEDIEILEKFIDVFRKDNVIVSIKGIRREKEYQAIENLIKGYKELQEENQMLRKVNKIAEGVTVKDVEKAILNANNEFKENYIEKSKVREKIKELQEEYIQLFELERKDGERETDCKIVIGEMEILEELLQEGDK